MLVVEFHVHSDKWLEVLQYIFMKTKNGGEKRKRVRMNKKYEVMHEDWYVSSWFPQSVDSTLP